MSYVIGMDIGGTNIKTVVVSPEGDLIRQEMIPTLDGRDDQDDWIARVREQILRIESEQDRPPMAIGLAAPGLAARDGRSIAWMQGRMEVVQGLDWTRALRSPRIIPVLNDAHAALLGEVWLGGAQGFTNVLMLTLGTGVGGAAMVDGNLLRGHLGRAGHLGHISLNPDGPLDIVGAPGSLEDAVGDCSIRQRTGGRFASTAELARALQAGDSEAAAHWQRVILHLGAGLASLINAFDPEAVILGGGIMKAGDTLRLPLAEMLDRFEWRPTGGRVHLLTAALGEWAGAYGAAFNAMEQPLDG